MNLRSRYNPFLLALLPITPTAATSAQEITVYTGTVGGAPVAALLENDTKTRAISSGAYFYRKYGQSIQLIRAKDGRLLECDAKKWYDNNGCNPIIGLWHIKTTSTTTLEGEWESADGKKQLPIKLSPTVTTSAPEEEFLRLRLENGKQKESTRKSMSGVSWIIRTDVRSGESIPILVDGSSDTVLSKVNASLQKEFQQNIGEALSAAEFSTKYTVTFANSRLFSLRQDFGYYYMGAAHPSSGTQFTVYDLSTGNKIDLKKSFRMAASATFNLKRDTVLDAQILRAYQRAAKLEQPGDDNGCFSTVEDRFECENSTCQNYNELQYTYLYPTEKGLAVSVNDYPEAGRACRGESVILPWASARKALIKPVPMP